MSGRTPTYWLSMHVPYACRHSGACCSAGWPIPIEGSRVPAIASRFGDVRWLRGAEGAPADVAGVLAVSESGHCVFHRDGCDIQHALGHRAMPSACQHFPREVLIDPRGVFVTLSHYCPTAADLLFSHVGPVKIVEGPAALPEDAPEGLDARDVLPPLLTEGVLIDLEAYSAWERHLVAVLTEGVGRAEEAITRIEADLEVLRRWRPGRGALVDEVSRLARPSASSSQRGGGSSERSAGFPAKGAGTPGTGAGTPEPCGGTDPEMVVRRYLAARAFASWAAYSRAGVGAVVDSLRLALSTLREQNLRLPLKEAIRRTDLQLVHLLPRSALRNA